MHEPTDFHKPFLISLALIALVVFSYGAFGAVKVNTQNFAALGKLSTVKDSTTTTSSDLKTNPPPPQTQSVTGEKVFLMGGVGALGDYNDVYSSSDGVNWSLSTSNAGWHTRSNHESVYFNGRIWVLGGIGGGVGVLNDIWNSADGVSWTPVVTVGPMWPPRYQFSAIVFNDGTGNKIWVMGGKNGSTYYNDVWNSSDGIHWNQVTATTSIWAARANMVTVSYKNKIWVIGGGSGISPGGGYPDIWSSSDGANWSLVSSVPFITGFNFGTGTTFDDGGGEKIFILGRTWEVAGHMIYASSTSDGITWTPRLNPSWSVINNNSGLHYMKPIKMNGLNGTRLRIFGNWTPSLGTPIYSTGDGDNWTNDNPAPIWAWRHANSLAVTPSTFGLPDLMITNVTPDPTTLTRNFIYPYIAMDFTVKNVGLVPLTIPVTTKFSLYGVGGIYGGMLVGQFLPGNPITLLPNQTYTFHNVNSSATPNLRQTLGYFNFKLIADESNVIDESFETNNTFGFGLTIVP